MPAPANLSKAKSAVEKGKIYILCLSAKHQKMEHLQLCHTPLHWSSQLIALVWMASLLAVEKYATSMILNTQSDSPNMRNATLSSTKQQGISMDDTPQCTHVMQSKQLAHYVYCQGCHMSWFQVSVLVCLATSPLHTTSTGNSALKLLRTLLLLLKAVPLEEGVGI